MLELQLFKSVDEDLGGSLLRRQVTQMLQLISTISIIVPFTLKAKHLELLIYLSFRELLTMIIYVYYMICLRNTCVDN